MLENGIIVVGWDFSELAEQALQYVTTFAANEQIKIVCVIEKPLPDQPGMIWKTMNEDTALAACEKRLSNRLGVLGLGSIDFRVVFGSPADEIVGYASSIGAAAIVLSTHGRTGLSRVLLGSVAERVMRITTCPVLLIPRSWAIGSTDPKPGLAVESQ